MIKIKERFLESCICTIKSICSDECTDEDIEEMRSTLIVPNNVIIKLVALGAFNPTYYVELD